MKMFAPLLLALISTQSFAGVSDVAPSPDKINPSVVEHVFNLQKGSQSQPSIRLIQVDNGGSSDISSAVSPSKLYLGIHIDGEEFDVDGNYLIAESLVEVDSAKMISPNEISLRYTYKELTDTLPEKIVKRTGSYTIIIGDALKETMTAHGNDDGDRVSLSSSVGMKNNNP